MILKPMQHDPIIRLSGINAGYENKQVLEDINLTVYEKDFLGIIGPNGGGKTTLMKVILGLLKPLSGNLKFFSNGTEVQSISMGYLPQYNSIDKKFPISVYEVVLSGLNCQKSLLRPFTREQHEQAERTIVKMGLEGLEHNAIGQLSGGQLQRALLGRALVSNPQVIILDEPNTYIDKKFQAVLNTLLEEINRDRAVILVSHDIGSVLQSVKSIACVSRTLHYHPDTEIPVEWLEDHFGCPIELLGHGNLPHRVLKAHRSLHPGNCCGK